MFKLNHKVIVLIGGAGLLGIKFSRAILEQGGVLYSLDIKKNEKIKALNSHHNFVFKLVNAQDKSKLEKIRNEIVVKEGHIDCLINATTMQGKGFYLPFEEQTLENWETTIKANLTVPFLACQVFIKQMQKQRSGSVINIASIYGIVGNDQGIYEGSNLARAYAQDKQLKQIFSSPAYNAAKGGLITFTKFLAAYYGKDNIRVNCISPGGIDSGRENQAFLKNYAAKTPLGRKAKPNEVNGAVIFLASDESSYVTGHNLVVDGGWTAW